MRVLLVNRYYGGQQVPTGRMLADLGEELVGQGHDVAVLTSADSYVASETPGTAAGRVAVTRLWTGGSGRLLSWGLFWLQVCLRVPAARWDRCVVLTDPPFMVVAARLARLVGSRRRRFYWWTMDLYPEALVARGMVSPGGWAHRGLTFLNEAGLAAVAGVICLGQCQRALLKKYVHFRDSEAFYRVVPPWDNRPLPPVERSCNRFLARYGWQDRRVALYAGNLGEAHCFREILDGARELWQRGDRDWMFVFVVRGASKAALEAEASGLPNVAVLDYQPPDLTADVLWAADVHLITMSAGWEGVVVPSKLYGVLHTAAPVLFIGPEDADTAEEIREYAAGATLPVGARGPEVVTALESLSASSPRAGRGPARDGPARVAAFITSPRRESPRGQPPAEERKAQEG